MNINTSKIDEIMAKIKSSLPKGCDDFRELSEDKFKLLVSNALQSLELVSREEYDVQTKVLQRTRERLEQLEQRLELLEKN